MTEPTTNAEVPHAASPASLANPPASGCQAIRFGRCVAVPGARALLRDGAPVEIGSRAFDLLMVLLRSRGELVPKADIVAQVWPTTLVEESNLRFQMASLRRALNGDRDLIKTVPGRGYILISDGEAGAVRNASRSGHPLVDTSPALGAVSSTIFVVEGDQSLREALFRLLRPFRAQVITPGSLDALHFARGAALGFAEEAVA